MAYNQLVFDASGGITHDELAFKDFGTSSIQADIASNGGRMSPNGVYEPDIAMHSQINQSSGSSGRYMSLDTYAGWFDIDTNTVLERCWRTMYPKDDYLTVTLNNAPDLYGPFWVPTTLVFALFLSSSLSSSIQAYLAGHTYSYDFTKLSVAVSVVYIYSLAIPFGFWAVMRYWAGVDERGPVDIVSIYGYSATVWIAAALLAIPPVAIARFAFAVIAFALSGFFILRNIYPILSSAQSKAARILILAVAILHFAFAVILWFTFLNTGSVGNAPTSPGGNITPVPTDGVAS